MTAPLPPNAEFEALVQALLSPDNSVRAAGEARLAAAKAAPDALARGALTVLRGSPALDARAFCAVLLLSLIHI